MNKDETGRRKDAERIRMEKLERQKFDLFSMFYAIILKCFFNKLHIFLSQGGPRSPGNKRALHTPQSFRTGASPARFSLVSYQRYHFLVGEDITPLQEMQSSPAGERERERKSDYIWTERHTLVYICPTQPTVTSPIKYLQLEYR